MDDNQFYTILTDIGREKFRDALAGRPIRLTEIAVGDGAGVEVDPRPDMTGLVNEVYRAPITDNTADPENPAFAILNLVIPIEAGGWHVREAGVYDEDGDLIFVGSMPQTYKPKPSMGVASDLSINLVIDIQRADTVIIQVDPSVVLASRQWTERRIDAAIEEAWEGSLAEQKINQAIEDALQTYEPGKARTRAAANTTVYLRADGDDTRDGLSEETARRTMNGILDLLAAYDMGRFVMTVDIGPGEFTLSRLYGNPTLGSGVTTNIACTFQGAGKDQTTLTGDLFAVAADIRLRQLTVRGQVRACDGGSVWLETVRLRGAGDIGMQADRGGNVQIRDAHVEIEGSFSSVVYSHLNGLVFWNTDTVRISDTLTCEQFCSLSSGGTFSFNGSVAGGELVTGRKWLLDQGGLMSLNGRDPDTVFPGTVNGMMSARPALANLTTVASGGVRQRATADVTVYVREDGDDANDGLTEATAKRTIDGGLTAFSLLDLGRHSGVMQFGPGRFSLEGKYFGKHALASGVPGMFTIQGAGKDETVLEGTYIAFSHHEVSFQNLTVEGTLEIVDSSICWLYRVRLRGVGGYGIKSYRNATTLIEGNCEVEGDFSDVFYIVEDSYLIVNKAVVVSDTLSCRVFASVGEGGTIYTKYAFIPTNPSTGVRWYTQDGGNLISRADPDTIFPGDQPGYANAGEHRKAIASITPAECLTRSLTQTGYARMAGGLIVQWGRATIPNGDHNLDITFPLVFPNAVFTIVTDDHVTKANYEWLRKTGHGDMSKTGFTLVSDSTDTSLITWQAYGY